MALIAIALVMLVLGRLVVAGRQSQRRPGNLGVRDGKLAPCPATPNCVSDQAGDEKQRIAPLQAASFASLKDLVRRQDRTTVVSETETYLHVEVRSALFKFVDDLEVLQGDGVAHVRSASRAGKSDLGVNRRRVEAIRAQLAVPEP